MTRVLIIEDVVALRKHAAGLVKQIVAEAEISECDNGQEGLRMARSVEPDLIIMDISMPQLNGIKAAQQIWAQAPDRKILFWSQYHREAYVRELGKIVPDEAIHGYALKGETDEKFAGAIRSILLQDIPYIDPVVRGVQMRLHTRDGSLTDVEYETILDIALGLTDKAIALRRHISVRGVQNRLSMVLDKLIKGYDNHLRETAGMDVYNARTRIVFEALRRGLIDPDDMSSMENELRDWLATEFGCEGPPQESGSSTS
ncbi:MAG TPA: response regulator transcription factor [Planktothrix sp.]